MKDYDQLVYDILKPLVISNNPADVYLNNLTVDENSQPKDYILYRTNISNRARLYGDGKVITRQCACDILVNEQGNGNNDNAGYLVNQVEQLLINHNIHYTKASIYNEYMNSIQTTFDFFL